MASLGQQSTSFPIRSTDNATEWSNTCPDIHQEYYLDLDAYFTFPNNVPRRSMGNSSGIPSDPSDLSRYNNRKSETTPDHFSDYPAQGPIEEAPQPTAKPSWGLWAKKLGLMEKNPVRAERKHKTIKTTKSHPDILSLGGFPSPPALPSSDNATLCVDRQRPHLAANGKENPQNNPSKKSSPSRRHSMHRLLKSPHFPAAETYATINETHARQSEMMNPSPYRAGFKDNWNHDLESRPQRFGLLQPVRPFPESPPPSARTTQEDFAAFGPPPQHPLCIAKEHHVSSQITNPHHVHSQTSTTAPLLHPYLEQPPLSLISKRETLHEPQATPFDDQSTLQPDHSPFLDENKFHLFDFDFSPLPSHGSWNGMSPFDATESVHPIKRETSASPTESYNIGLGINTCDPSKITNLAIFSDLHHLSPRKSPFRAPHAHLLEPPFSPHTTALVSPRLSPLPSFCPEPETPSHHRVRPLAETPTTPVTTNPVAPLTPRRTPRQPYRRTRSLGTIHITKGQCPKSPSGAAGPAPRGTEFINLTPHHSKSILSGVAPSGSSKTKARRDREAADRRRTFSLAAFKVISEAGGDVEGLRKVEKGFL